MCRATIPALPEPVVDDARLRGMWVIQRQITRINDDYEAVSAQLTAALATVMTLSNQADDLRRAAQAQATEWNDLVGADMTGTREVAGATFHLPTNAIANAVRTFATARAAEAAAPVQVVEARHQPEEGARRHAAYVARHRQNVQGHKCGVRSCDNRGANGDVRFRLVDGRRLYRCAQHANQA